MRRIEILAPAGSYESLVAAVNASCDAVYIGGIKFGARAYADNLADDNMLRSIDYVHVHDKKIYMTVNTLLKNPELENELYNYIYPYYKQGLDAVIVQDVGVLSFLHQQFPELPLHASTQMTLTMAQGAEVLKEKGITRVVTARELGIEEIKTLRAGTNLEIESFVHGALCYCYSGQCLMSSIFGGRSGNRGRCAQPCRMPYQLISDGKILSKQEGKYIVSPKDICTLEIIPQLIEAGIDSFKIEGRMKRPEYAAGVTAAYRKYVDKYFELGKEKYETYRRNHKDEMKKDIMVLKDLYNRGGFTQGYYGERNGKSMISLYRPNHSGVLIGKVEEAKGNQAVIRLEEGINAQDILEIRDSSDNLYEFTVKSGEIKGKTYSTNIIRGSKVKTGNQVYRTKNNKLLNYLTEEYLKEEKKIPVSGELKVKAGEPLRLKLKCRDTEIRIEGDIVQEAQNQPMTEDKLRKQLLKTNETSYEFTELNIIIQGNVFIPVQKLNELRRNGLMDLSSAITGGFRRKESEKQVLINSRYSVNGLKNTLLISAAVSNKEQLMAACEVKEVSNIYLESDAVPFSKLLELTSYIKQYDKNCYIILPHIFRNSTYQNFLQNKTILSDDTINGYILRNFEEFYFAAKELQAVNLGKELITDYNLYVMNHSAVQFYQESGIHKFTAPVELNYNELKEMAGNYHDMIVYGNIPLMVSAQCLIQTVTGGSNKNHTKTNGIPCCGNGIKPAELVDRYQKGFKVKRHCRDCYNTIYNSQCLSLLTNSQEVKELKIQNIRLNFTDETVEETKRVLKSFIEVYHFGRRQVEEIRDFTRGHFKRGVE
ncbi:MAG: U32 family peptidase [Anaerocolumna sp.]